MADVPSRLLSGQIYYKGGYISITKYRDMIFARSLYSLDNQYKNTNKFSLRNKSNVASSISTVLNVIPQYNRMQVNTNLLGNTYDAFRDEGSALAKIGLVMLGKQMAYNIAANSTKRLPSINISRALKGGKLFNLNKDNRITVEDKNSTGYTFGDRINSFSSKYLGIYDVFGNANPFPKANVSNNEYIKNTGAAQLSHFYHAINLNIYKPIDSKNFSFIMKYSGIAGESIKPRSTITNTKTYFNFGNENIYPYAIINFPPQGIEDANKDMQTAYRLSHNSEFYAPTNDYVINNFGKTIKEVDKKIDEYVKPQSNFSSENNNDKLIWGRDGTAPDAENFIKDLRGDKDNIYQDNDQDIKTEFKIKAGLLEYTKNLLNASSGYFVDITRKAFKRDNDIIGFQGSPLWEANNSKYSVNSGNANDLGGGYYYRKTGIRQHTILDPYGSDNTALDGTLGFAKSIRFKGNEVYNSNSDGNQNSVIYNTVLPRIHPTRNDKGEINNKNLMFSLENLAVGTIKREKFGVIDDEYGTPIPLSEVGQFAGRLMWFPPYNVEINEVAIAKYESTVMVGRNEPIYNYQNSERTAVLSFSLLVDYPEQLRNPKYKGENKNKVIADFFAFGGDPILSEPEIETIEEKIEKLKRQLEEIGGPVDQAEPPELEMLDITIFFQNNQPNSGNINTIIDIMYNNPNHYEIINGMESAQDGNGFGYNEKIYYRTGLTKNDTGYTLTGGPYNQYTLINTTDPLGTSQLNKNLLDVYQNEDLRKYYDIKITGSASKLYNDVNNEKEFNETLGNQRVAAAKKLIVSKLTAMFGASVANEIAENNIKTVLNIGSIDGSVAGAKAENMHEKEVKKERSAVINFARNDVSVDKKDQKLNIQQKEDKAKILQDIQSLELQLSIAKNNIKENIYKKRNKAILNSFESISGNQFYPVFHSQTPEDFHRRLTFLQQCTRQGAAKRYDVVDEDGKLRAKNSVFGKQPICVLRVGDFFYTKVVIESVTIDYADTTWDMNPEGFGIQPMMANITLQMKIIGGQSLKGPIDALQNAVTFNYYANSTFTDKGMYNRPAAEATKQEQFIKGVIGEKNKVLNDAYDSLLEKNKVTEGTE